MQVDLVAELVGRLSPIKNLGMYYKNMGQSSP